MIRSSLPLLNFCSAIPTARASVAIHHFEGQPPHITHATGKPLLNFWGSLRYDQGRFPRFFDFNLPIEL